MPRLRSALCVSWDASSSRSICMARAMDDVGVGQPLFDRLLASFFNTADWMRNREG